MPTIGFTFAASRNPTLSALWITHPDYALSVCAKALTDHRGSTTHAATALGIARSTLKYWFARSPALKAHALNVREAVARARVDTMSSPTTERQLSPMHYPVNDHAP